MLLLALCALVVVVAACSGGGGSDGSSSTRGTAASVPFERTNWVLTDRSDLGTPLGDVAVTARFVGATMSGSSGCNTYTAPIARDDPKVEITGPVAVTQLACTNPAGAVEQAYLKVLPDVRTYAVQGAQLTLRDLAGKALLVYRAGGADDIVGDWVVTSLYTGTAIQSVGPGTTMTARFTKDSVSGDTGCNAYGGTADIGRTTIRITDVTSTQRFCAEEGGGASESDYLRALGLARTYEVNGNRLTLFRQGGTIAASFERA
jgi:heat shock protein HslJ